MFTYPCQEGIISSAITIEPAVLSIVGLSFQYPSHRVFTRRSWCIPIGVTWVTGGEGCGKTTLLRLLAGALPAASGDLHINGISMAKQPAIYRQQVFWADPKSEAFEQISATAYFESLHGFYPRFDNALLSKLASGLALTPHLQKPLYMLSTGSKRKVWLAAAMASGAAVTLLDEPFAALDLASMRFVRTLLTETAALAMRAVLLADYVAPPGVPLASVVDLGD